MVNQSIIDEVLSQAQETVENGDYDGYCLACGEISEDTVEPDAERYPCSACEKNMVFGAEQILIHFL